MQLLVAILDVFSVKWQPDKKKGQPPGMQHVIYIRSTDTIHYSHLCHLVSNIVVFYLNTNFIVTYFFSLYK